MRRAQEYDATIGVITAAVITAFSLNGSRAQYTVKITRGESRYKIHLTLLKQGDTWKILGFDLF